MKIDESDSKKVSVKEFETFTAAHPYFNEAIEELISSIDQAEKGDLYFVIGPTGVGKSTLGKKVKEKLTKEYSVEMGAKGLVYGAILVDDWPEYVERWLKHRPRGLVVMPASSNNVGYNHPNVIRYDGSNIDEVRKRMILRFNEP